jgi:hypothetical protein
MIITKYFQDFYLIKEEVLGKLSHLRKRKKNQNSEKPVFKLRKSK